MGAERSRGADHDDKGAVTPDVGDLHEGRRFEAPAQHSASMALTAGSGSSSLQRAHLASLQRTAGNSATTAVVQRALGVQPSRVVQLQRWTVPASLACDEVVPHMDSSSPYAPEWAATRSTHTFNGQVRVRHETNEDGTVESTAMGHPGVSVSVSSPVDRPHWNPSPRPNRAAEVAAFGAMRASLDAHESEHQRIGQTNNAELQRRYRAVNATVTGSNAQSNTQQLTSQLQTDQQEWANWAQEQQDDIDPFRGAVLNCPAPPEEVEEGP